MFGIKKFKARIADLEEDKKLLIEETRRAYRCIYALNEKNPRNCTECWHNTGEVDHLPTLKFDNNGNYIASTLVPENKKKAPKGNYAHQLLGTVEFNGINLKDGIEIKLPEGVRAEDCVPELTIHNTDAMYKLEFTNTWRCPHCGAGASSRVDIVKPHRKGWRCKRLSLIHI